MLCEHLKELQEFVKDNQLEIGGLDMIRLVCKKCDVQHECPEVSSEYWEVSNEAAKQKREDG